MLYEIANGHQKGRTVGYSNGSFSNGVSNGTATSNGYSNGHEEHPVVDLRSDTISKPTQAMRDAMYLAPVGDDVYGEDPTVNLLIQKACELLGKEDGILVPSGTMANLIAIMVHCRERGSELICGDNSHTFKFEQGGPAQIAGVQQALVKNLDDGTFCLEEMKSKIRVDPDCHEPTTSLIIVENTHNICGGKVLPLSWLDELTSISKSYKIPVHMDGARIMNAAVALNVPVNRIVKDIDTVCFCLSKGLGAPIGSLLLGSTQFIQRATRVRKALGGGMRQSGIIAAAGLVALDSMIGRLKIDHDRTLKIARAISDFQSDLFKVDLKSVQTNILMVYLDAKRVTVSEFLKRLYEVKDADEVKVHLRATTLNSNSARFVLYWEITEKDVDLAIGKLKLVVKEFEDKLKM
ncbi:uncharacterized protein [Onthophagus taurus]|uniref:uncharacterized protein n=1 Tax=Onthophagus taurus TaxID=166361 RepID=UPI0039BDC7B6